VVTHYVVIFGQSLLLSLVADSLSSSTDLCILQATSWDDVEKMLAEGSVETLIYDFTCASESNILPMLFHNPHLLLIGLDVETNRVVHLTGYETRSLTLERVKEIVLKH
jgi:hypothetical protein